MKDYTSLHLRGTPLERTRAAKSIFTEGESLTTFKPPRSNGGPSTQKELFDTLFLYNEENTLFRKRNKSPVCSYEAYIEDGSIEFAFYTPSPDVEEHYRKQLQTHYNGCELGARNDWFTDINEGEYVSCVRFKLNRHYFEPLQNHGSSTEFHRSNPYKSIFGELTMRSDMRAMLQFMYKPAEPDWTKIYNHTVEDQAEELLARNSYDKQTFGLRTQEIEPDGKIQSAAKQVKNQSNTKGYYMDVRMMIIGPDKEAVEDEAEKVGNLFEQLFESAGGQRLVPDGYEDENRMLDVLENMILRKPQFMSQPKDIRTWLHERRQPDYDTLIMSINDLVALAPIPYQGDFSAIDSIVWADKPLQGTVSGVSESWTPLTEEEREEEMRRLKDEEEEHQIPEQDENSPPSAEALEQTPEFEAPPEESSPPPEPPTEPKDVPEDDLDGSDKEENNDSESTEQEDDTDDESDSDIFEDDEW